MSRANWKRGELEQRIVRELESFLPARVFDAHAHLYRRRDLGPAASLAPYQVEGPAELTVEGWRQAVGELLGARATHGGPGAHGAPATSGGPGGRLSGGLFFPMPAADCDLSAANAYLVSCLAAAAEPAPGGATPGEPSSGAREADAGLVVRGSLLVSPSSNPGLIERLCEQPGIVGLKPYHVFSGRKPTMQALPSEYLPEWAWELAHRRGLVITVHLVRDLAIADPDNQRELRERLLAYPGARVILAHAGRSFSGSLAARGVQAFAGLENVWFDTAAVCEAEPLLALLDAVGPRRVLWGTDFPVSQIRGRAVSVGDGFLWLDDQTVAWDKASPPVEPTLVGLESLRALRVAAERFGLNGGDLQDIFHDNAMRLLGLCDRAEQGAEQKSGSGGPPAGGSAAGERTQTARLYAHGRERIPGGTQLLSKRPEMFAPGQWPAYFREARGCETWDLDGRHYYDFSTNGIGSCLLGFRDPDVTRAVQRRIALGSMSTLNPPEEVALADRLCGIHPWAEQVRFARTGGEIGVVAVRIARATTGRSGIAICGYHGWHDWYLAANLGEDDSLKGHLLPGLEPEGVPPQLRGTAMTFPYGDLDAFGRIMDEQGERIAAVIMEPCRYHDPAPGFLEAVRDRVHSAGGLLIFDEITIGWRLHFGGAHLRLGVNPDLAIFAKALGNGHPIAAVVGTRAAMEGAHVSFISSTYWTEGVGPAAALATLEKMERVKVSAHVADVGTQVAGIWRESAARHRLPVTVEDGYPCLAHFHFDGDSAEPLRTLFTQLMLERGFLAGTAIYPTLAHTPETIERYGVAVDEAFGEIARILAAGRVKESLRGPVAQSGFRRLV